MKKETKNSLFLELAHDGTEMPSKSSSMRLYVRADIKRKIKSKRCVILGTENPLPNYKNGRKDDLRIMNVKTQVLEDFQPLSKAANDAKRQICKDCKATDIRYDAKNLGYPISFTQGVSKYKKPLGCVGCYWYDPIEFMKNFQ
jgi:ICEA Protein